MSNNFYNEDGETQPMQPRPNSPEQQSKLVPGSFHDQPQRSPRRPYQNPGTPQQPYYGHQPSGKQPVPPMGNPNAYPNAQQYPYQQPANQQANRQSPPPAAVPNGYPYQQAGQIGNQQTPPRRPRKRKRGTGCLVTALVVILLLCIVGGFAFTTAQRVLAFGSAISPQTPLSTQTGYMNTSARTNVLIMGYGGQGHDGAFLTDSLMVISVMPQNRHTTLLSVPRDLWIQYPPNSGQYTKINSVYEFAGNNTANSVAGGNAAAQKISLVTGLNVPYWVTINFAGFRDLINSIGGIDVYVPDAFNACYPANDNASINPAWTIVNFKKGTQHMDGNTAIAYARAREPLAICGKGNSENLAELTDFARSARQQIIIKGVLSKIRQISTWPKLYAAMTALQHTIYTNMSLTDLAAFALKMNLSDPNTAHVGLSNQNVLVDSTSNNGQYILLPQNNDWQAVKNYVQQHLYN